MLDIATLRLRDYTGVIRRRYWIIVVLAAVAALTAFLYSARQQPAYQAAVSVLVTPNVMDHWTTQAVERLMNAYVDRTMTHEVAQRVIDLHQLDVPPNSVLSALNMTIVRERYKVIVQANSNSPDQAVHVANGFAAELAQLAESEESSGPRGDLFLRARVVEEATGAAQIRPRVRLNVAVALVLGAMAGVVLALMVEFLDARVRLREEAEQLLGAPMVACIPPVAKSNSKVGEQTT